MKLLALILFYLLLQACRGQMLRGRPAEPGDFPFAVQVHINNCTGDSCFCGGSIIGPRWAITAAHCVRCRVTKKNREIAVVAGDVNIARQTPRNEHRVEIEANKVQVYAYPEYDTNKTRDTALLFIYPGFKWGPRVNAIQLAPVLDVLYSHQECTVMGWGNTEDGDWKTQRSQSPVLLYGKMSGAVVANTIIYIRMKKKGDKPYLMHGDSGGPLVCADSKDGKQKLYGWGTEGGKYDVLYARLGYYREWMLKKMKEVEARYPLKKKKGEKLSSAGVGDL